MLPGEWYVSRHSTRFSAFNKLQVALMKRFVAKGGSIERWMDRLAPVFRSRYSWLCEEMVPIRITTAEHEIHELRRLESRRRHRH